MCMYRQVFSHLPCYVMVNLKLIRFQMILSKYLYDKMTSYIRDILIVKHTVLWKSSSFLTYHLFALVFSLNMSIKMNLTLDSLYVLWVYWMAWSWILTLVPIHCIFFFFARRYFHLNIALNASCHRSYILGFFKCLDSLPWRTDGCYINKRRILLWHWESLTQMCTRWVYKLIICSGIFFKNQTQKERV